MCKLKMKTNIHTLLLEVGWSVGYNFLKGRQDALPCYRSTCSSFLLLLVIVLEEAVLSGVGDRGDGGYNLLEYKLVALLNQLVKLNN